MKNICLSECAKLAALSVQNNNSFLNYFFGKNNFEIIKVREGNSPAIVSVSGFTTEGKNNIGSWSDSINIIYPENAWYHIEWSSQNPLSYFEKCDEKSASLFQSALKKEDDRKGKFFKLFELALATAVPSYGLGLILKPLSIFGLSRLLQNPWTKALLNCENSSILLAETLRIFDKDVILIGHSLGARMVYKCLRGLANSEVNIKINECHLLGGAVTNKKAEWLTVNRIVTHGIYNYHSANDLVLNTLYRAGTLFDSAIGKNPIGVPHIYDKDVTDMVKGHSDFIPNFHFYHVNSFAKV